MRWRRFLPANAAGGILWAAAYGIVTYLAGNALRQMSATIALLPGAVVVLATATVLVLARRQAGRLALRAEAAYPGPLG
jgi:membrane protein DedA with SNARE-associated domain